MSETQFREIGVQEGYALWAASYDQEQNGLIFLEERQVEGAHSRSRVFPCRCDSSLEEVNSYE